MNNPLAQEAYTNAQREMLSTLSTQIVNNYLDASPLLAFVRDDVEDVLEQAIDEGLTDGELNMQPLSVIDNDSKPITTYPWSNQRLPTEEPRYHELLKKALKEVAEDVGYTDEQIENGLVFRAYSSDPNAYTFSPLKKRLLFVVYNSLQEGMTYGELKAVIAHELGHIVMKHVLYDIEDQAMTIQLLRVFLAHADLGNAALDGLKTDGPSLLPRPVKSYFEEHFSQLQVQGIIPLNDKNPRLRAVFRNAYVEALKAECAKMNTVFDFNHPEKLDEPLALAGLGLEEGARRAHIADVNLTLSSLVSNQMTPMTARQLLMGYLEAKITSLSMGDTPYATQNFFKQLYTDLARRTDFEDDPLPVYDAETFLKQVAIAGANESQMHEAEADLFSMITERPISVAGAFAVLSGTALNPNYGTVLDRSSSAPAPNSLPAHTGEFSSASLEGHIRQVQKTVESTDRYFARFYANNTERARREALGGNPGQDHPVVRSRIVKPIDLLQRWELVAFRIPIVRLAIIHDNLESNSVEHQTQVKEIESELKALNKEAAKISKTQTAQVAAVAKKKIAKKAAELSQRLTQSNEQMASNAELAMKISTDITDVLSKDDPTWLTRDNHDLDSLLDFYALQRQRYLIQKTVLGKRIAASQDDNEKQALQNLAGVVDQALANPSTVLADLAQQFAKDGSSSRNTRAKLRAKVLNAAIRGKALDELTQLRSQLFAPYDQNLIRTNEKGQVVSDARKLERRFESIPSMSPFTSTLDNRYKTKEEIEESTQKQEKPLVNQEVNCHNALLLER